MEMVGAPDVVAGDDGDEGGRAVRLSGLHTAEGVGLDGGGATIAVALGLDASVDTGRVAAPELDVSICHGLAAGCVDDIDVKVRDGALLASEDVFADQLTSDPWQMLVSQNSSLLFVHIQ